MKRNYSVDNANGIELQLCHSQVSVTDSTGTHPGDDEMLLTVADVAEYETDLISDGHLHLHFKPAQARRFARLLWQMARRCKMAEDYKDASDIPDGIIIPDELLKDLK